MSLKIMKISFLFENDVKFRQEIFYIKKKKSNLLVTINFVNEFLNIF